MLAASIAPSNRLSRAPSLGWPLDIIASQNAGETECGATTTGLNRPDSMVSRLTISVWHGIDHLCRRWRPSPMEHTCRPGRFLLERRAFMLKTRIAQSEYIMNIFYIIGVIVVVLFVAGFFGLHA
jgi:hypothetical protein